MSRSREGGSRKRPREGDTASLLPSWLGDPCCGSVCGRDCVASARSLSSPVQKEKNLVETKALVPTRFVAPKCDNQSQERCCRSHSDENLQ